MSCARFSFGEFFFACAAATQALGGLFTRVANLRLLLAYRNHFILRFGHSAV
jgi:hypothetical protein